MMKTMMTLLLLSPLTFAEPLTPISSERELCEATISTNTYQVEAACWRNRQGEARLWFPSEVFNSLKDTRINTKYIRNTEEACNQTNEYTYDELFGANKLDQSEIVVNPVTITYRHLDASACYNN